MSELDAALTVFAQEAEELLTDMEDALLSLETKPDDSETINSLFRAMHTIKGSSGLFGFSAVVGFTHEAESVLDKVRNGERSIDAELISVLLDSKDHTAKLIEHCLTQQEAPIPASLAAESERLIRQLTGRQTTDLQQSDDSVQLEIEGGGEISVDDNWLISLEFQKDAFRNGMDPLSFIRYLRTLGEIKQILTMAPELPAGDDMDPENCYLHFKIAFQSDANKQTIEAVFDFASDDCDIKILPPNSKFEEYVNLLNAQDDNHVKRLGDMLVQVGALTQNDVDHALQSQQAIVESENQGPSKPLGEILVERHVVQQPLVDQALKKQEQTKQKLASEANYIRVDATKLGHLINLVGELVISSAAMNLIVERHGLSDAGDVAASMNALVSSIRDTALELRMVQIGETFSRFKRVVRDVSKELNKDIELYISGGETELDKTVVEKINDPLTHLIRNALDHGIESPAQRLAVGKPAQGTVQLNAYHESGHIVIQIADDGAGLNSEKILDKALANGLVKPDHDLSQQDIHNLIFAAGLSTKDQATNLSGRGVGMDVVKKNIEALRGSVEIDSIEGEGTTISIRLPLTLAIIDGFMVGTGQDRYIIPLSMVDECIEMNANECEIDEIQHYINLRGQVLPYLRLGDYFHNQIADTHRKRESVVVVKSGQTKAGFVVDELHGEHQTVIKPLGKVFERLNGITGATVLGDGNVALILDVQGLIQAAIKNKSRPAPFLTSQRIQ
ncbi:MULTISPECIES: chemotaxis protein CheA [Methylomonas]|uniref:Chemotaxis protein CheA n=2 Tax=Methylomonas TaxID=416 RepID=A0A126T9M0_9GAMM|nr:MULTISPECIES: chemotaxis protein CheA [Methylomonas]AMK78494.1 chemotaxis protein CheA [Methylomonas denitrificans]OAH97401.1 chemotaxis protein CheA [Methylomonas methanica]TCV82261.1 two-component system chemotaxis sensor kinase CheA [Methylomonas methanica]